MRVLIALAIFLAFLIKGNFGQQIRFQFHVVVAKDGSGNFATIGEAIAAAPNNGNQKYYILVKQGVYAENVVVDYDKTNIVLVGESMDKTKITGNRSNGRGFDLVNSATVAILGNGFMAQGITFENSAGAEMEQAAALFAKADAVTFYQCRFVGYQDTLYTALGRQFFRDCEVIGTIDFILGDASAVFQNCAILARKPEFGQFITYTAQQRMSSRENTGIVLQNCTIKATSDLEKEIANYKCYLGRPWRDYSRVVLLQNFIDFVVDPTGWVPWPQKRTDELFYAEYDNRGPGANRAKRVAWSREITDVNQACQFTVRIFLQGGTWIPSYVPHYLDLLQVYTCVG